MRWHARLAATATVAAPFAPKDLQPIERIFTHVDVSFACQPLELDDTDRLLACSDPQGARLG